MPIRAIVSVAQMQRIVYSRIERIALLAVRFMLSMATSGFIDSSKGIESGVGCLFTGNSVFPKFSPE